jgi:subfamily B ATP-binding cassette protein MsbA
MVNRRLVEVYFQYWKDILRFIIIGIILSFLELLGISVVLPILDGTSSVTKIPYPLNIVSELFVDIEFGAKLRYIAIILIIIYFLKGIFYYINGVFGTNLERKISKNFILKCFKGVVNSNVSFVENSKDSELFSKAVSYAGGYGNVIKLISNMIPMITTLILLVVTLFFISPYMLALSFSIAVLSSLIIRKVHEKSELAGEKIALSNMKLNSIVIEEISGIKTRRLSNSLGQSVKFVEDGLTRWSENLINLEKIVVSIKPIIEFLGILALALILFVFSYFLVDSSIFTDSSSVILTFLLIFTRILPPIASINTTIIAIKANMPYFKVTEDFLKDLAINRVEDGDTIKKELKNSIQFQNVSFQYNQDSPYVLNDVSFSIPVGSKVGIVGLSGSGKSSLIDLLLRHYQPSSGKIIIDGLDLNELELTSWYETLGVVSQDPFFFNETINYNISFSQDFDNIEKVIKAAKKANIHKFVETLPNGYKSLIGGRGELLSGGQRQRIAIARALYHNPDILIFDEATSALDTETENEIRLELAQLTGKTIVMVAHRLSTIMDSDIIIVVDNGKLIQCGSPGDLIEKKKGKFYQLISKQLNNEY